MERQVDYGYLKKSMELPICKLTWEQIMDLIGSINYIENRLGGRKPNQERGKSAQRNVRKDFVDEKNSQSESSHFQMEYDNRLGRKIDTTA